MRLGYLLLPLLLLGYASEANADYLEVRRSAWVKRTAEPGGEQLESLEPNALVELISEKQTNGYYEVRTRGGTRGYLYRTLVRRHRGDIPRKQPAPSTRAPSPSPSPVDHAASNAIRIATFNIQSFGKTKFGRAPIVAQLVDVVRSYPLVAVQELSDSTNQVPGAFLAAINAGGHAYDMLVSPRSGLHPSDKASQEQYAFYFDTTKVEALSTGVLFDDSEDLFQREPFMAQFKVRAGSLTLVAITIHTSPEIFAEIEHLHEVVEWARTRFPKEDDFVVLGDLNASCNYASPEQLDELQLRNMDLYSWLVPDDADTNLAPGACAYDRIVVTAATESGFSAWGVDRSFADNQVSDRWPVWASFGVNE